MNVIVHLRMIVILQGHIASIDHLDPFLVNVNWVTKEVEPLATAVSLRVAKSHL